MKQVIVIGSGPAGCSAAIALALRGREVVIFEKRRHPRPKVCAGGLPPKAIASLPVKVEDILEDHVDKIRFSYQGNYPIELSFSSPVVHMVDRARLDDRLARQALELGARLFQGVSVNQINDTGQYVELETNLGTSRAQVVIAADGSLGSGARYLGSAGVRLCPTAQVELPVGDKQINKWQGRLGCDFGIVKGGIAWVFPKEDRLTIGVCSFKSGINLRKALLDYLAMNNLGRVKYKQIKSHPFPAWDGRKVFSKGAVLVAGDAAGLVNPLTGAGIRRACISGQLAAEAAHAFLENKAKCRSDLGMYERRIREDLLDELKRARLFSRLFYSAPGLFYRLGVMNYRINPWVGELLSGRKSYSDVFVIQPKSHIMDS
jgi:geranylgeranyl reductase family protein